MTWSRRSRAAFWLAMMAMLAMVAQGLVTAWLMPPVRIAAMPGAGPSAAGGLRVVTICSGAGLRRIVLDGEGEPAQPGERDGPADKSAPSCPLCTGLARCTPLVPAIVASVPPRAPAIHIAPPPMLDSLTGHHLARPSVRDPPLSV